MPKNFFDGRGTDLSSDSAEIIWSKPDTGVITSYEIKIGTTPGGDDVLAWKNIGNGECTYFCTHTETGLILNQGITYYTSIRSVDDSFAVSEEVIGTISKFKIGGMACVKIPPISGIAIAKLK